MLKIATLSLALLTSVGFSSWPIIIRHDVADDEYLELGQRVRGLVHLNLPDGQGVLIAPEWVLTAAHVGVEVEVGETLTVVGSGGYRVAEIVLHPEWDDGPHDLALIRLAVAVMDVEPVTPYRHPDEVGKVVVVAGAGDVGTGRTGPVGNDGRVRAATNRVDEASEYWLRWTFDDPEAEGSQATPLEGISGPGDSGGPAYYEADGVTYVVGVSSGQSTRATGGREGFYGVTEFYTRVSNYADWIAQTIDANR